MTVGPSPWRTIVHEGERFMVRDNDGATWVVRISDRECWLYDGDAPDWTRATAEPMQGSLL